MRIVIAGQTYSPSTNGPAVFSTNLAEALTQAGHHVMVMVPSESAHAYQITRNGVCVHALAALPLSFIAADVHVTFHTDRRVGDLLDAFQPDIVHIQDHYPLSRSVVRESLRRKLPLLGTNNFVPDNIITQVPIFSPIHSLVTRVLWKTVLDVFNKLTMATAATETSACILRAQGLRVPVQAISSGVDLERFRPISAEDRAALRQRYGLDPHKTLLLYVGRVDQDKGLDLLLHAFAQLQRDDLQLAIAGKGSHLHALQALAKQLCVDQHVVLPGYIPDEDLPALHHSADIFVMPSEVELQSIATLEAMATGRPVIAANACALPEIVTDDVNGYLFQPGDAADAARCIAQLSGMPERWAAMGAASLARVQPHDLSQTAKRYQDVYSRLITEHVYCHAEQSPA